MIDKTEKTALEQMAERIAALEATNKELRETPFRPPAGDDADPNAAAQAVIKERKNANSDLVQVTAQGNVRTTRDPSDQFVSEQDTAGQYGDAALAEAHALEQKGPSS